MRTYDETFDRIMSKKTEIEKEHTRRNKRIMSVCIPVFALFICAAAVFTLKNNSVKNKPLSNTAEEKVTAESEVYTSEKTTAETKTQITDNEKITAVSEFAADKTEKTAVTTTKIRKTEKPTAKTDDKTTDSVPRTDVGREQTHPIDRGEQSQQARQEDIYRINFALSGVDEADRDKINTEKSYCECMLGSDPDEENLLMHLEGDTFYYEVIISGDVRKIISSQKKYK